MIGGARCSAGTAGVGVGRIGDQAPRVLVHCSSPYFTAHHPQDGTVRSILGPQPYARGALPCAVKETRTRKNPYPSECGATSPPLLPGKEAIPTIVGVSVGQQVKPSFDRRTRHSCPDEGRSNLQGARTTRHENHSYRPVGSNTRFLCYAVPLVQETSD